MSMPIHSHSKRTHSASSQSSTVFLDRLSPVSSTRKVRLSDCELLQRVFQAQVFAHSRLCPKITPVRWEKAHDKNNCKLSTREANTITEALVEGDIACTIEELASLFRTASESDHNAMMKSLHGKKFIYGSMVHVIRSDNTALAHQLSVKTTTFANTCMFSKNEERCYVEYFQPISTGDGFTITSCGLADHEVQAGRAVQDRVDQLQDVIMECALQQIPGKDAVRLQIYGCYCPPSGGSRLGDGYVSASNTRTRLFASVKAFCNTLKIIQIRRERMDNKYLERSIPNNNNRCPVCTKAFCLFSSKTSCQICAYSVCGKCCTMANMETYAGYKERMVMCRRCIECIGREEQPFNN